MFEIIYALKILCIVVVFVTTFVLMVMEFLSLLNETPDKPSWLFIVLSILYIVMLMWSCGYVAESNYNHWIIWVTLVAVLIRFVIFNENWRTMEGRFYSRPKMLLTTLAIIVSATGLFFAEKGLDNYRWNHADIYVIGAIDEVTETKNEIVVDDYEGAMPYESGNKIDTKSIYFDLYHNNPMQVSCYPDTNSKQLVVIEGPTADTNATTLNVTLRKKERILFKQAESLPYIIGNRPKDIVLDNPYHVGDTVRVFRKKVVEKP